MQETNDSIIKKSSLSKYFLYTKGEVSLDFTLNMDTKDQMRDFLELLKLAAEEVTAELGE